MCVYIYIYIYNPPTNNDNKKPSLINNKPWGDKYLLLSI